MIPKLATTEIQAEQNKKFWDELCGTTMFRDLGLTEINPSSIEVFDRAYFAFYPYLKSYFPKEIISNKDVMEIGLGFGTVSQFLFQEAKSYTGVDIAEGPVKMVNDRINWAGKEQNCRAIQDTALNLKLEDESFDTVVSIGCLHHTGDIKKVISEVHRVLRKNGTAVIMLYNKKSFRIQISRPFTYYFIQGNLFKKSSVGYAEFLRGTYDNNAKGEAAPVTDYFSKSDICDLFKDFSSVSIHNENFDEFSIRVFGKVLFLPRKHFMNNIAKFWGLDNYIIAKK